jgi:adenosylmethionine-8-amino-7-oxononanoate aminotransferase
MAPEILLGNGPDPGLSPLFNLHFFGTGKRKIMDTTNFFSKNELINYDLNYLWHPFTQMKEWSQMNPLFILSGEGNYLIDMDGNRYLDGVSSLWANIHGHGREEINKAIEEQLQKISHSTLLGLTHPLAAVLAQRLSQLAPGKLKTVAGFL